jgi:hypothetical protein
MCFPPQADDTGGMCALLFFAMLLALAFGDGLPCGDPRRPDDRGCLAGRGEVLSAPNGAVHKSEEVAGDAKTVHTRGSLSLTFVSDESSPTSSVRPVRSGTQGQGCSVGPSNPYYYVQHSILTDTVGSITVTAAGTTTPACAPFVSVLSAPFNPSNICANYVWDSGSSAPPYTALDMSFSAAPNSTLYFVVLNANVACTGSIVTLTITGVAVAGGNE